MFRSYRLSRLPTTFKARGQRGFAFIYALMGIAIISTIFYTLSTLVNVHSTKTYAELNMAQGRMILHSLMDYTILAVKQRYCLTESWLPERAGCDLNHSRAIDRLLLSMDSERHLLKLIAARRLDAPTPVRLDEIRTSVRLSDLLPDHPLYEMLGPLRRMDDVSLISFVIRRDRRPKMATSGRETFLQIQVEIQDSGGEVAMFAGSPMTVSADLSVFPREIGSMALIVANDLRMDRPHSPVDNGNFNIHMFPSRAAAAGYGGLVFASPVLVNGDVYLPPAAPSGSGEGGYAAVTFADKLFFPGRLFRGTEDFSPRAAGRSDDQLWADIREFGGFQRGVEIETGYDRGLMALAGTGTTAVDTTLADQCVQMIQVKSELRWTSDSALQAKHIEGRAADGGARYRIGFNTPTSYPNPIIPQPTTFRGAGPQYEGGPRPPDGRFGEYRSLPPIQTPVPWPMGVALTATLLIPTEANGPGPGSTLRIAVSMEFNSTYSFVYTPPVGALQSQIQAELREIETRLANPLLTPVERAFLNNRRRDLERDLQNVNAAAQRSATIELRTLPVMTERDGPQPVFADLVVSVSGELVNVMNQSINMDVKVESFDISCRPALQTCREDNFVVNDSDPNSPRRSPYTREGFLVEINRGAGPRGLTTESGSGSPRNTLADDANYAILENRCTYKGQSVGGVAWDSELDSRFAAGSPVYWNFAPLRRPPGSPPTTPAPTVLDFDASNARVSGAISTARFHVQSIVPTCRIRDSANFVAGFLACETLIIDSRDTPLTIIGTVIVTRGLIINPAAYRTGIWWSSLYNSTATPELRRANILKPTTAGGGLNPNIGSTCANISTPMWHPFSSLTDSANIRSCNVGILRAQAKPFTWTAIDPDCGLLDTPGEIPYVCKNQLTRYQLFEIFRESSL